MIVVAGHEHDPPPGHRLAQLLEEGPGGPQCGEHRPLAQLEHVAEQNQVVDALQRGEERRSHLGAAQQVGALDLAEVEVRDEGGGHAGSANRARRAFLSNLPTDVLGTSSMNSTRSGSHHLATRPEEPAHRSASSVELSHVTTHAHGRSLHSRRAPR